MRVDLSRLREQVGNVRSDISVLIGVGVLVGIGSGLAGLVLHFGLHHLGVTHLDLPRPVLVIAPAIGAGLAWLFLQRLVRTRQAGIGEVIWAASRDGGRMSRTAMFAQMVASWLTVGSGGSAGPEGPIAYTGAAIGSNVGTVLGLSERRRIALLGCGVAGAISAIFNAPVTGMLFALEVVLGEWISVNILPIAIASVVANVLAKTMRPGEPIFSLSGVAKVDLLDYVLLIGLAVLTALGSVTLTRSIRQVVGWFRRLGPPGVWKPMLGGLLVGSIGLLLPHVQGEGYAGIRATFSGTALRGELLLLAAIALVKIAATACTLGSGGCGGLFAPSLFTGAYLGLFYHELLRALGVVAPEGQAAAYALIGMAGMVGGTLHAPLTAIFLVAEVTGSYDLLLPLILVTAVSAMLAQHIEPLSLYAKELAEAHGSAQAIQLDSRILADLSLEEVMVPPDVVLREQQTLFDAGLAIQGSDHDIFPVADAEGHHAGMLRTHLLFGHDLDVQRYLLVADLMDADWPSVRASARVAEVLPHFESVPVVPVLDGEQRLAGFVSARKLFLRYRQELLIQTAR